MSRQETARKLVRTGVGVGCLVRHDRGSQMIVLSID